MPLLLSLIALPVRSHELWIEPQLYQVEKGGEIAASLKNGQNFEGIELGWFDGRIQMFDQLLRGKRGPIEGRPGDIPAVQGLKTKPGLVVLAYASKPSTLTYETWDKFQAFYAHKDLGDIRTAHQERGLPDFPIKEVYTRFSKALIGVGHAKGTDENMGLETELIALANPYRDDVQNGFPVLLLYQGAPRVDVQIELFDRAPDGTVRTTMHRTDAQGRALLPVFPGHEYLVDAVVLRVPAPDRAERYNVQWESLWAALTFAIPD